MKPVMFRYIQADVCVEGGEVRRMNVMVPHRRFAALCGRQFVVDEDYALVSADGIPGRSRAPLFIAAKEAWNNLPEDDDRFPSWEHVRHKALVEAGWAHHTQVVMDTPKDAKDHARGLRKVAEYAVIVVKGCVVDCWIPKSIASGTPGLTKEKFQEVKTKALDWIATLARTSRAELEANAGRSA